MLLEKNSADGLCPCSETAGHVTGRRDLLNFELRETVYSRGLNLGLHRHASAYLSYVIEGSYTESYQGSSAVCGAGSVRFLPAHEVHANHYDEGARCLLVELEPHALARLREHGQVLESPGEIGGSQASMLARRLYSEFRQRDDAASIAIEGLVLEILAEGLRSAGAPSRNPPRWLMRARDMIDARFLEVPSLTDIAKASGVHPVHLSREFRRYFDVTVGEYMRKLRIEHASRLLAGGETPLAEIADVCGFADQSHFSSTFKRTVGLTPARFREMHG